MLPEKKTYGLIGKNINYSFSKNYFTNKFIKLKLKNCSYTNFDLLNIAEFENIILKNNLNGLNVTIPYKEKIIPYLDSLDLEAKLIGAVNTIKIDSNKKLKGYNTDYIGFLNSIKIDFSQFLPNFHNVTSGHPEIVPCAAFIFFAAILL